MFSLLPMCLWCSASTSDSYVRGSWFQSHFFQFFKNFVEFLWNLIRKNSIEDILDEDFMLQPIFIKKSLGISFKEN